MIKTRRLFSQIVKSMLALILILCLVAPTSPITLILAGNTTPEESGKNATINDTGADVSHHTIKTEGSENDHNDININGYASGEVLAPADSMETAQKIAATYKLELKSYAYGVAVLIAPDPELAVARSNMTRQIGAIRLSLNRIYTTYGSANTATTQAIITPVSANTATTQAIATPGSTNTATTQVITIPGSANTATTQATSNTSPIYNNQWHHGEIDTGYAHALSKGANVTIAVIDTGIDAAHPAFNNRILKTSYNSYTNQIGIPYVQDDNNHGTHISGIASACAYTGERSIIGIAPDATILTIKANISNTELFDGASLIRGINYAAENGADIINMSLGRRYSEGSDTLEHDAIIKAVKKGVTVVCAAGNDRDSNAGYPAAYPEVIAVSATRQGWAYEYSYSNYGPEIDIAAPASDILSVNVGGGFEYQSGTSIAAPNVSGVAALIKSLHPGYTPEQIRDVLCITAREAGEAGRDDYYGYGVVNAYAAVLGADALFTVTYNLNDGKQSPVTVKVIPGRTLLEPYTPQMEGYAFEGWYISGTNEEFKFSNAVVRNLKLDAKWVEAKAGMYTREFPDRNFRREVLRILNNIDAKNRKDSSIIDKKDTDLLASISNLSITNLAISGMTGLSYFQALQYLYCSGNLITKLDTSGNTSLIHLECGANLLIELNTSKNTRLVWLDCSDNNLGKLDVTGNTRLIYLNCQSNQLTALDVSKNTDLVSLMSARNKLTGLEVPKNYALINLWVDDNMIMTLNVSKNTKLEHILSANNELIALDVSKNTELVELRVNNNKLTELNISKNLKLQELDICNNQLQGLNVSNNTALKCLWIMNNAILSPDSIIGWRGIGLVLAETPGWNGSFFFYPQRLPVPSGLTHNGNGIVTWNPVTGAKWYYADIEGLESKWLVSKDIGVTLLDLRTILGKVSTLALDDQQLQIRILAVAGNSLQNPDVISELSAPVSVKIPVTNKTPVISIDADGNTLRWNEIPDAGSYILYADGLSCIMRFWDRDNLGAYTRLNSLRLDYGYYNIQIRAIAGKGEFGISELSNSVQFLQPALTPLKTPEGVAINNDIITWKAVEGAEEYSINISGDISDLTYTQQTGFNLRAMNHLTSGETYRIQVTAIGDWLTYSSSQPSESVLYVPYQDNSRQLNRPSNLWISGTILTWNGTANADRYRIFVDGKECGSTGALTFDLADLNLSAGTYQIRVKSCGVNETFLDSELSDAVTYTVRRISQDINVTPHVDSTVRPEPSQKEPQEIPQDTQKELPQVIPSQFPPYTGAPSGAFLDIAEGTWYEEAVLYVYEKNLMNGISKDPMLFSPDTPLSRAMIVTILYRQEHEPDVSNLENPFSDVQAGTWYTDAVKWAAGNGIVTGHPDGRFAAGENITRQDLAVIFIRYADTEKINLQITRPYKSFSDNATISLYARDAVARCFETDIINGKDSNKFDPSGKATRAETATMLYRFLKS